MTARDLHRLRGPDPGRGGGCDLTRLVAPGWRVTSILFPLRQYMTA